MKKIFNILLVSLVFISCEENISYLGEFKQQYSLNSILRSDSETHFATIKSSYAPGTESAVTDVQNALVKLILPDTTLLFTNISSSQTDSQSISSFYYLNNFNLTKGAEIKIEALLPDGKILSAKTRAPRYNQLTLPRLPNEGGGPTTIPDESFGDTYNYRWLVYGNYETLIYGPSFYIVYFTRDSEEIICYKKVQGNYVYTDMYSVPVDFINNAMREISIGIDDKSKINIIGACFEVKVFDNALGIYVNSIETFEDEFSIRIAEPDISNIDGGLGIFGTYISETFDINITADYIISFGYTNAQ